MRRRGRRGWPRTSTNLRRKTEPLPAARARGGETCSRALLPEELPTPGSGRFLTTAHRAPGSRSQAA